MLHQLPFGTKTFKKQHQLQFEKHNGINRGTTSTSICLLHKFADEREVKCSLQMAIEMMGWNEVLQ